MSLFDAEALVPSTAPLSSLNIVTVPLDPITPVSQVDE